MIQICASCAEKMLCENCDKESQLMVALSEFLKTIEYADTGWYELNVKVKFDSDKNTLTMTQFTSPSIVKIS
jgi:hypothetical protein